MEKVYSSTVGVEFDHVMINEEKEWLYYNFEKYMMTELSTSEKVNILK